MCREVDNRTVIWVTVNAAVYLHSRNRSQRCVPRHSVVEMGRSKRGHFVTLIKIGVHLIAYISGHICSRYVKKCS